MIDSIEIQNFRCFESVKVSDCRRVNIIVGRNAGGKTALLEAIYLAAGESPLRQFEIKNWRGQGTLFPIVGGFPRSAYEDLWRDLFFRLDQDKTILITFTGSSNCERSLRILYKQMHEVVLPGRDSAGGLQVERAAVVFLYRDQNGQEHEIVPVVTPQGIVLQGTQSIAIQSVFFATQVPLNSAQYADYFSSLSKQKKQTPIVEILRTEFDFIEEITVETGGGGQSVLYAAVRDLPEKIPIAHLSSGVSKLLCVLLGIALKPKGVVLIDEMENGFYFDRLPSIWALILRFAKQYDVQIFASTHSRECLEAAADIAEGSPDDFGVLRTVKVNGKSEIRQFGGGDLVYAINENVEIR